MVEAYSTADGRDRADIGRHAQRAYDRAEHLRSQQPAITSRPVAMAVLHAVSWACVIEWMDTEGIDTFTLADYKDHRMEFLELPKIIHVNYLLFFTRKPFDWHKDRRTRTDRKRAMQRA
jgi:hypothetical protein